MSARTESAHQRRRRLCRQKGQCTWCGGPVPKGRRQWCGDGCVDRFLAECSPAARRRAVLFRDRGVCALCGTDTERIRRIIDQFTPLFGNPDSLLYLEIRRDLLAFYRSLGFSKRRAWWEADHQVPLCRGGSNDLSNLRTLCCPCHRRVTAELAADRASERRDARRPLLRNTG